MTPQMIVPHSESKGFFTVVPPRKRGACSSVHAPFERANPPLFRRVEPRVRERGEGTRIIDESLYGAESFPGEKMGPCRPNRHLGRDVGDALWFVRRLRQKRQPPQRTLGGLARK